MAINTDSTETPWGDRKNRKQCIMLLPAKAEANKPAIINLQSVAAGVVSDNYLFINDTRTSLMLHTEVPGNSSSEGTAIGGVATLDEAFDATGTPGVGIINGATATGSGNCLRVGGEVAGDKIEFWHSSTEAHIHALTDNLFLSSQGGDIDFSSDNITSVTNLTMGGTFTDGTLSIVSGAITIASYNGLGVTCGTTNAFTLTRGTASIVLAEGDTDLNLAAAANVDFGAGGVYNFVGDIDIDTAATVDIDADLTLGTGATLTTSGSGAITLNQSLATTDAPGFATGVTIGTLTLADGSITDSSHAIDFGDEDLTTTGNILIAVDGTGSVGRLGLGANGTSDSYIEFSGGVLNFWDTTGGSYTLNELATGTPLNPTLLSGSDLTITAGNFTWTNDAPAETAVWTLAAIAADGIQIDSKNTSADVLQITALDTDTGNLISLNADATMSSGCYLYCSDGAQDFAVKLHGEIEIAGAANTDMFTMTLGNAKISSGKLEVDSAANNIGSHFITNESGQSTSTLLVHNDNGTGTSTALEVIQDATGGSTGMSILHDGTGPALHMTAATGRLGYVIHIPMASQLAEQALFIDGAPTAAGDEGVIEVNTTGVLAAGGNLLRLVNTGNQATASFMAEIVNSGTPVGDTSGTCLVIDDNTTAVGTSYAVDINSNANLALHVSKGGCLFADSCEFDGGINVDAASTIDAALTITGSDGDNVVCLTLDQNDTDGSINAMNVTFASAGKGIQVTNEKVDGVGYAGVCGIDDTVVAMMDVNGGAAARWIGADGVGIVTVQTLSDFTHVGASCVVINKGTSLTQTSTKGSCLRILDASDEGSGYAMEIASSGNLEALQVTAGTSAFTELVTFIGGVVTKVVDADLGSPPLDAEMDTQMGAAAQVAGFIGFYSDSGGATQYLVVHDGTSWFQVPLTACG